MDKKEENVGTRQLLPYMEKVIATLKRNRRLPAVRTYTATKNSFTNFCQENKLPSEVVSAFTDGRLKEYENWLRGRNAEWNTVSTYMRVLKAVYNRLVDEKVLVYNKKLFKNIFTGVESHTKRALPTEQMSTLLNTDVEQLPQNMQSALAYFLLMFMFHGMPFIDLAYLRKKDLKGDCIVYCRHKTGRQITVRIPTDAKTLMEKFCNKNDASIYLFPILDNSANSDKRKDEEMLYRCYERALGSFNRKLVQMANSLLPGMLISSYTARHTWATLAFHAGVSIGIICKALGHSSIKVTETYLKPFENEKVDTENDKLINAVACFEEKTKVA